MEMNLCKSLSNQVMSNILFRHAKIHFKMMEGIEQIILFIYIHQKGKQNIVNLLIETRGQTGKKLLHVAVESGKIFIVKIY